MKFDNKLIVSDIDGTFIDENKLIAERNIDAVNYFKENGGLFTFATGRCDKVITPDLMKLANAPIICCNGAYIYDCETQRRINEICIAPGPAITMVNTLLESFPGICVTITADRKYYLLGNVNEKFKEDMLIENEEVISIPIEEIPTNQWYSIILSGDPATLDLAAKYLSVAGENAYFITRSWETMLEIYNIRASKGAAALELKHMCETRAQNTHFTLYSIGDFENDADLLKISDLSACPSNATGSIQDIADITVCSNNDGAIAGLIEYIDANV